MILNGLPNLDPKSFKLDHGFVFDAHNHDRKQLIIRYRGTAVERTELGTAVTGWQKSIYHFGGLNREVPIVVSMLLDEKGRIRRVKIDPRSEGSQGKRCDFACLETLCGEKLTGVSLAELGSRVSSAPDVKCLHLFEILSACSSFYSTLAGQDLQNGTEQEYIAIFPERNGLRSDSAHEILGQQDRTQIRLEHRTPPRLNGENLAQSLDAVVTVRYNGEDVLTEELNASDFETVYAQLNRLFSRCHHLEKAYFGLKGRVRFFNTPSMVGLYLLTISHSGVSGLVTRAWKIVQILLYLQTGYGKNPCKGFGG
ncbi:MAG: hypothetical protein J6P42_05730 [Oscillospiraceae bacterium]|nr:hypothetical protein [Oscillospiraceae bacterium]